MDRQIKATLSNTLRLMVLLLLGYALLACQTMPKQEGAEGEAKTATTGAEQMAESKQAEAASAGKADTKATAAASAESMVEEPKAPAIVESCKDEPYVGYEKQARASIAKGLAATQAGTYGVGFRDLGEHKKWTEIHNQLFTQVNKSCQALSECAKQNPKNKEAQCAEQAKNFNAWQEAAAQFVEKAKQSETTQPPMICSFEPNLDDPQRCFQQLAANIDKACDSGTCKTLSDCWRAVGFLDAAIAQAKRSCGFVHESLDKCRGYVEAKGRRAKKFEQCQSMQGEVNIAVMPVL
jgi:hypothetical protein